MTTTAISMDKQQYALYNGELITLEQACIPITDKGYFFDFAIYDSIKVIQGKLFFPEYHVERLLESARLLELDHPFAKEQIVAWYKEVALKNKITDALLRAVLIGDPDGGEAKIYIFPVTGVTYYPHGHYSKGVKVITYRGERRVPQAKSKDLLLGFLGFREAQKQGAIDALLIDHSGNITEGTRSNIFAFRGNTLITPPASKTLGGITKKIVLDVAQGQFEILEADIPLSEIKTYDELLITSTSKNVMPIAQIDGETIFKPPFPKTKVMQTLFKKYYQQAILDR